MPLTKITRGALTADIIDSTKLADNAVDTEHIAASAVETAKINADAVTSAKIADGQVDTEHLAALAVETAKIGADAVTNAKVADGEIDTEHLAADAVTSAKVSDGTITADDINSTFLQPIKSDISALALREATNESSASFNLPNQFIETFTDDTNLGTQTDCDRGSGYMTTIGTFSGSETLFDYANTDVGINMTNMTSNYSGYTTILGDGNSLDSIHKTDGQDRNSPGGHSNGSSASTVSLDYGSSITWTALLLGKRQQHGDWNVGTIEYSANGSSWTGVNFTGWSATHTGDSTDYVVGDGSYYHSGSAPSGTGLLEAMGSDGTFNWYQFGTQNGTENSVKQKVTGFTAFDARYFRMSMSSQHSAQNSNASWSAFGWYHHPLVSIANATGTLIQSANAVGSAKTKVGGVIFYKDNAGTATLGTDLKIYFSCNNGGAWTEAASYNAITPVYSTGIKQVRLGETTCTSGTGVIYKAVWANQAGGSKETQLHGIGINY